MARAGVAFGSADLTRRDVVMTSSFNASNDDDVDVLAMEPDLANTAHMKFVDNRCACCPYGYHIDIDFLRYLDSLGKSAGALDSVSRLQEIHDNKRRLRKSMEMFLHRQELEAAGGMRGVESGADDLEMRRQLDEESSQLQSLVHREDQLSSRILENMDSSLFHTSSSTSAPKPKYRSETGLNVSQAGRERDYESSSSVSIYSGPPSPTAYQQSTPAELLPTASRPTADRPTAGGATVTQNGAHGVTMTHKSMTSQALVTGGGMSDEMETLLVDGVVNPGHPGIPADMTLISSATLQTIREQMGASVRRMKQLEDENDALRLLEARMSVLKEEKKMMELQRRQTPLTRTVAVGDSRVDEPIDEPIDEPVGRIRHPLVTKKPSRDMGVGDGDVFAVESDVGPVRIHEREVSTEQNTEVKQKEIKTVFLNGGPSDSAAVIGGFPQAAVKPKQTRSIGVGDYKVFEVSETDASSLQVHEKELRTVYVGGAGGAAAVPKSTRNVGILCKTAMREVGVMYHCDDAAPMTRSIAVGVGEMGVSDSLDLAESSDSSVHITNMALQQLNMAAFQSRHLRFSNEQVRTVLDQMLKKTVHSVSVQCRFATVDRAVGTTGAAADYSVSVGCSDDTIDVDVVPVRQFRSVAIDCRPSVFHRACGADFVYRVDSSTNTHTQGVKVDRASNTDTVVKYPAATNTESRVFSGDMVSASTETESTMFGSVSSGGGGDVGQRPGSVEQTKTTSDVRKVQSSLLSAGAAASGSVSKPSGTEPTVVTSSKLARQKKRDSMLFGDVDEPPLIVAGDSALSTSSVSVGSSSVSGVGSCQLMMPGRTVSEPTFSQTTSSSSSRESFVCRSDEAVHGSGQSAMAATPSLQSTDGASSSDTQHTVVFRGDVLKPDTVSGSHSTQSQAAAHTSVTLGTTSEGSLRSIMKSSSSDKDSSSPSVSRRRISFIDSSEQRSDGGEDSQRSSMSFEEGTYDGRQGSVTYSCRDDEEMMKSSAAGAGAGAAVMYEQRYQQPYVMSAEMSAASATYAQWLDDQTQVSAKDLNASKASVQQEWFTVSGGKLSSVMHVETMLTAVRDISQTLLEHVVNMADSNGNTALHYAVSHGNFDVVSLLLDTGVVDVNQCNKAGYTAVMLASLADVQTDAQRDVVLRLFRSGNVNLQASQAGQTALMLAVSHGRCDLAELLLEAGADVNVQDEDGSTALMCASEHGHVELVKLLLNQANCDANITDNDGSSAMSIAMEAGHKDVGVMLYAHVNFHSASPKVKRRTVTTHTIMSSSSSGGGGGGGSVYTRRWT